MILLVEDNPNDEELTLRALRKANIANEVAIARNGQEALDFLFGEGKYAGASRRRCPPWSCSISSSKLDGIDVLQRIRADPRTSSFPWSSSPLERG